MKARYTDYLGDAYTHPVDLTSYSWSVQPLKNERTGLIARYIYNISMQGKLKADGQSALDTAVTNLIDAYSRPGDSWEFLRNDNTAIGESLPDDADRIGYIYPELVMFPVSAGAEYATQRNYQINLSAVYAGPGTGTVELQETVTITGDNGARNIVVPTISSTPIYQTVANYTPVYATQSGYLDNTETWASAPSPLWSRPIWDGDQSAVAYLPPQRMNGGVLLYRTTWNYNFSANTTLSATPNT